MLKAQVSEEAAVAKIVNLALLNPHDQEQYVRIRNLGNTIQATVLRSSSWQL
jgi:hypothetical protein